MASSSSTNVSTSSKKLTLKSSDGRAFKVEEEVGSLAGLIKNMIEGFGDCPDSVLSLPNVNARELAKVIQYCRKHFAAAASSSNGEEEEEEKLKEFDFELVKDSDYDELFSLILAANYLDVPGLMDLLCQTAAERLKDKTPEEIRMILNIENDFTREEEEAIRKENDWAFS